MNIDVVSFQRLAYRIFDELGKTNMAVLEETGKNLVLRKVAEERMDDLCVMQGNMKKMGYISEVKSLISELTQYNIDPDTLETFIEEQNMPPAFSYKLQDILTMYRVFVLSTTRYFCLACSNIIRRILPLLSLPSVTPVCIWIPLHDTKHLST